MSAPRRAVSLVLVASLAVVGLHLACRTPDGSTPPGALVFKHGKVPGDERHLRRLLDRFEAETGYRVVDETLPSSSDLQHQTFVTILEGGAAEIDVLSMDIVWVAEFARAGWLADLTERARALEEEGGFFAAPLAASTHRGRLYGVPWYVDAGVLYYRKDLLDAYGLAVPRSFPELAAAAETILEGEGRDKLAGFLWQGKQYEGLVCVALEVLSSFGGGVLRDGRVVIDEPASRRALRFLRGLVERGVSPPAVAAADEEATRRLFGAGRAVFLRNWVYAWTLFEREGSPVRGRVGIAPIPPGPGGGGATLGGWQLGIARRSKRPEAAWALVEFLVRPEVQMELDASIGYRPSRRSLYEGPSAPPHLRRLLPMILGARPRPVTPLYLALSQILQAELSAIVAGVKDVDRAVADARREIEFLFADLNAEL